MALNTFGWTPAEVTQDSAGNVVAGVTLTVFTDVTKTTQVTALYGKDGVTPIANGVVISDTKGRFGFKASDTYSLLYVYDGSTADPWPIAAHEALDSGAATHAQAVADAQAAADSAAASASAATSAANNAASATAASLSDTYAAKSALTSYATVAPSRALRRWQAALADRANGPANIVFLGDSLAEGRAASTVDKGWAAQATSLLRSRFPVAGLTAQPARNYIPTWYGWSTYNSAKEFSGVVSGVTQQSSTGLGLRNYRQNAASTITVTVTGSAVDLVYAGSTTTGSFTYAVDGGAPVTVNTANGVATTTLTDGLKTRVTFGSAGTHTLALAWVSSSVFLGGVIVYNGDETKGIRAFDAGHSGLKITDYTVTTNPPFEAAVAAVSPHLVAISLGENDYTANVTAATSKTNLQSAIARIKAAMPISPSFVLMGWSKPHMGGATYTDTWDNYLAMYREIAAADPDNVTVFEVSQRIDNPGSTNALGLWDADLQHLSTKGAAFVADSFVGFVSPR